MKQKWDMQRKHDWLKDLNLLQVMSELFELQRQDLKKITIIKNNWDDQRFDILLDDQMPIVNIIKTSQWEKILQRLILGEYFLILNCEFGNLKSDVTAICQIKHRNLPFFVEFQNDISFILEKNIKDFFIKKL